jgi:hypothetical protein
MSDTDPEKLALTCQHLAAVCRNLAADVPDLEMKARFLNWPEGGRN